MLNPVMMHQDFESVDDKLTPPACGGWELSLLLATEEATRDALTRAQEHATVEAEDVVTQADEALVMG